jgi:hypothetical protein
VKYIFAKLGLEQSPDDRSRVLALLACYCLDGLTPVTHGPCRENPLGP